MGDAGIFAQGTELGSLGGGLIVESSDPATSRATIAKLGNLLVRQGVAVTPVTVNGAKGFSIQDPSVPESVYVGADRSYRQDASADFWGQDLAGFTRAALEGRTCPRRT